MKDGGAENAIVSSKPPPKKRGRNPKEENDYKDEIENIKDKVMHHFTFKCRQVIG